MSVNRLQGSEDYTEEQWSVTATSPYSSPVDSSCDDDDSSDDSSDEGSEEREVVEEEAVVSVPSARSNDRRSRTAANREPCVRRRPLSPIVRIVEDRPVTGERRSRSPEETSSKKKQRQVSPSPPESSRSKRKKSSEKHRPSVARNPSPVRCPSPPASPPPVDRPRQAGRDTRERQLQKSGREADASSSFDRQHPEQQQPRPRSFHPYDRRRQNEQQVWRRQPPNFYRNHQNGGRPHAYHRISQLESDLRFLQGKLAQKDELINALLETRRKQNETEQLRRQLEAAKRFQQKKN